MTTAPLPTATALPRVISVASALVFGACGVIASFAPDLVFSGLGQTAAAGLAPVAVQLLGAAYLGLAILNWMMRHALLGGIYGRPLVLCNLLHVVSGALALVKGLTRAGVDAPAWVWILTLMYALFAVGYGLVFVRHPLASSAGSRDAGG